MSKSPLLKCKNLLLSLADMTEKKFFPPSIYPKSVYKDHAFILDIQSKPIAVTEYTVKENKVLMTVSMVAIQIQRQ